MDDHTLNAILETRNMVHEEDRLIRNGISVILHILIKNNLVTMEDISSVYDAMKGEK